MLRVPETAAFLVDLGGLAHEGSGQGRIEIFFELHHNPILDLQARRGIERLSMAIRPTSGHGLMKVSRLMGRWASLSKRFERIVSLSSSLRLQVNLPTVLHEMGASQSPSNKKHLQSAPLCSC